MEEGREEDWLLNGEVVEVDGALVIVLEEDGRALLPFVGDSMLGVLGIYRYVNPSGQPCSDSARKRIPEQSLLLEALPSARLSAHLPQR